MARSRPFVRVGVALAVLAGLGFMFVRSVRDVRAEPYTVSADHLRGWTLELESASQATAPLLILRPPHALAGELFRQVFARVMESLKGSSAGAVPLVLQGEFEYSLARTTTPAALLAGARDAGLENTTFTPRCLAVRRISEPGSTRQLYFVIFDAPDFQRFRERLAVQSQAAAAAPGTFDAAGLSPVLIVGATDANLNRWLPIKAVPDADCVAPVVVN